VKVVSGQVDMQLSSEDQKIIRQAVSILENPGFAVKATRTMDSTVEMAMAVLPEKLTASLVDITRTALGKAMQGALFTLDAGQHGDPANKLHKLLVALSGAAGGSFGVAALTIELPVSTTIMLRSIADIARSTGEDITDNEVKLACLEVFALSDSSQTGDGSETGYYAIRTLLARSLSEAAAHIGSKGLAKEGAPAVVKLLHSIALRFSVPISEKILLQSVPVVGAMGGASVNLLFIRYFQEIAQAHFAMRQLEKKYGHEVVKNTYQQFAKKRLPGITAAP